MHRVFVVPTPLSSSSKSKSSYKEEEEEEKICCPLFAYFFTACLLTTSFENPKWKMNATPFSVVPTCPLLSKAARRDDDDAMSRRLALFFVQRGCFCASSLFLCLFVCFVFFFSSSSRRKSARSPQKRERETRARECSNQRRRVNLERKRRDVRVFSRRWSMRCVVLRHRRAPAVCFFREKDQPTRAKEKEETKESSRSSCAYIYITRGKRNRCVVCIVRARVVRVFFGNEGR